VAAPVAKFAVRGKLVREDDPDEEERERERSRRREETEDQERILRPLEAVCKPARTGVTIMAYGSLASCGAAVLYFFYFVSTLIIPMGLPPILFLSAALVALHWLLTVMGFGFCAGGPKAMRPMAISGLVVMVIHAGVFVPLAMTLAALFSLEEVGLSGQGPRGSLGGTLILSNLLNNLTTVTDLPVYLLSDGLVRPAVLILPVVGGALEFAKLSLIGILTNHYAVDGKDPELGHLALRFVYRIFWLVIAGGVLKLGIWLGVKMTGGEPLLQVWFAIMVLMVTNAYFLWWAFTWYAQFRTMLDVTEVITATRFADRRQRLDVV
jgi:hypothetical protein